MSVFASDPESPVARVTHAAAMVIVRAKEVPHSAPGHWAGALYEAGLLARHGHWCSDACAASELHLRAMELDADEQLAAALEER